MSAANNTQTTLFRRLAFIRLAVLKAQNDLIDVRESINRTGVPDNQGFVPAIDLHAQLRQAVELLDEAENYLRPEHYHTDQGFQAPEVSHG